VFWTGLLLVLVTGLVTLAVVIGDRRDAERLVTLTIIGTNDLHGAIEPVDGRGGLAVFAGYVNNVRARRHADGGGLLLLDAGDMFQGTLESNLNEGAAVVAAYNAIGYSAAAIGNHEFDYGPVGPAAVPETAGDDPRGALKARAAEAYFPFLAANLVDPATWRPVNWPNVRRSVLTDVAGVQIGLIGVTTRETFSATQAANTVGLALAPLSSTIALEAARLRGDGAQVVVVVAHAGGSCRDLTNPMDLDTCDPSAEIMEVARTVPTGLVDVIVAGHAHSTMAHEVAGIAIIESLSSGRDFGRVDLIVDPATQEVVDRRIYQPREVCALVVPSTDRCDPADVSPGRMNQATYEQAPVEPDAAVAAILAPAVEAADELRAMPVGVTLETPITRARVADQRAESALGNLFADLLLDAVPGADTAIVQSGGLRADLPPGPLKYGDLYRASPFDNRVVELALTGSELVRVFRDNLTTSQTVLSIAGLRVTASCDGAALAVVLGRPDGSRVAAGERLRVVTTDFLAAGGDDVFSPVLPATTRPVSTLMQREAMLEQLRRRGGLIAAADLVKAGEPRMRIPAPQPEVCGG